MTIEYTTALIDAKIQKIPRQKIVNIKLRDNQFVPQTN